MQAVSRKTAGVEGEDAGEGGGEVDGEGAPGAVSSPGDARQLVAQQARNGDLLLKVISKVYDQTHEVGEAVVRPGASAWGALAREPWLGCSGLGVLAGEPWLGSRGSGALAGELCNA